jgi:hypothetical protein
MMQSPPQQQHARSMQQQQQQNIGEATPPSPASMVLNLSTPSLSTSSSLSASGNRDAMCRLAASDIEIHSLIGSGSFGDVYRGICR